MLILVIIYKQGIIIQNKINKYKYLNSILIMQIKELTLPPNEKKITYQISKNGKTNVYLSPTTHSKKSIINNLMPKIQLGQLNSIQLTPNNQLQNIFQKNPYQINKGEQKIKRQAKRTICCSCKKSKCLKMYCQCFANKLFCGDQCQCSNCTNTQINAKKLLYMRQQIEPRKHIEQKGCRCQKSGCNKKYCECFSRKQKCGQYCECLNCQNIKQHQVKSSKKVKLQKN